MPSMVTDATHCVGVACVAKPHVRATAGADAAETLTVTVPLAVCVPLLAVTVTVLGPATGNVHRKVFALIAAASGVPSLLQSNV
jgi:hypothetical protein